ncbi:hypothetical protein FRC09_000105 [Ceratobasidium sp. 395]|nr:hypothetical protein FRC09_000105 [Ceratobasidium sp. 395]
MSLNLTGQGCIYEVDIPSQTSNWPSLTLQEGSSGPSTTIEQGATGQVNQVVKWITANNMDIGQTVQLALTQGGTNPNPNKLKPVLFKLTKQAEDKYRVTVTATAQAGGTSCRSL